MRSGGYPKNARISGLGRSEDHGDYRDNWKKLVEIIAAGHFGGLVRLVDIRNAGIDLRVAGPAVRLIHIG